MAGNLAKSDFVCFDFQKTLHSRDVFYALSCHFVRLGFRLNCVRLAVHYFAVYVFGFRKFLNEQTSTACI